MDFRLIACSSCDTLSLMASHESVSKEIRFYLWKEKRQHLYFVLICIFFKSLLSPPVLLNYLKKWFASVFLVVYESMYVMYVFLFSVQPLNGFECNMYTILQCIWEYFKLKKIIMSSIVQLSFYDKIVCSFLFMKM